tara:strand:+ start:163 stop:507 length:345 start_codon:yes stop_codon:yes gene_type:complete
MAQYANIIIDQGSSFARKITVRAKGGTAFDLTNYTARGQLRKSYTSLTAVTFTSTITNSVGGEITISLTTPQTTAIKAGRYVYDVEIVPNGSPEDGVIRVIEGQVTVTPRATQI